MIQTQHVDYEIYFVMFYMILTFKYKEPILCTLPLYSSSRPPRHFKMSGAAFWLHDIVFQLSVFTSRKLPNVLHTRQYHHSVITQCVVKKQTGEASAFVIAGKLKTSSVLTTNKNKSHKTKLSGYIF